MKCQQIQNELSAFVDGELPVEDCPIVPGHEAAGEVAECGPGVTTVKPGEVQRDWYLVDAEGQTLGRLATRIADASPLTVGIGKQAFYAQIDLDQPKAYAYTKEVMAMNSMAADAQEGISAFLGKRAACWAGK